MKKQSKKQSRVLTVEEKYEGIVKIMKEGLRHSEWQEAGLLHLIEDVIEDRVTDLSPAGLEAALEEASEF